MVQIKTSDAYASGALKHGLRLGRVLVRAHRDPKRAAGTGERRGDAWGLRAVAGHGKDVRVHVAVLARIETGTPGRGVEP